MDFATLHRKLPYVTGETVKILEYSPYPKVTLAFPGRHQADTVPVGGDFVVMVDDPRMKWKKHQFTHDDIFANIESKAFDSGEKQARLMELYAKVVLGADPDLHEIGPGTVGIDNLTYLHATQCLAVAEHRRYKQHESKGGGRYLPVRFASGIVEGLWTAEDCKAVQRRGRPGLDSLIAKHGKPYTLKEWANGTAGTD